MTQAKMTLEDFQLSHLVCEVRFDGAYLLFDRTGGIWHSLKQQYPTLTLVSASPNSSTFRFDTYTLVVELELARIFVNKPPVDLSAFQEHCDFFFNLVIESLDIRTFTRIGLRPIYSMSLTDPDLAQKHIRGLHVDTANAARFGIKDPPVEVLMRWESDTVGCFIRFVAQPGRSVTLTPTMLRESPDGRPDSGAAVLIDIDYYTLAVVDRAQWRASEWIEQSMHLTKREVRKILSDWQ